MKRKSILALLMSALLAGSLLAAPASAGKKKKSGKPLTVAEDAKDDWGGGTAPSQIGAALGQDLVGAEIGTKDGKTIDFVIKLASLPPSGGVPELSRYVWSVDVDGDYVEIDGKFSNYTRGACDPTSGQCPPPRDPGMQPFLIRANCGEVEGGNVTTCEEVGIVQATFDAAAATITIPVPAELINVKPGSKIGPGSSAFTSGAGGTIIAAPSAFLSINNPGQLDAMLVTKTFVVPGGKKKK